MFVGHFALGFAGKKLAPRVSLGTLFLAVQFLDLLWPAFLLLGVEHVRIDPGNTAVTPLDFYDYPVSHSLAAAVGWSAGFGLLYWAVRRHRTAALVLALGVLSHWLLDAVAHRPDLPLLPRGGPYVGLGLWNAPVAAAAVELTLFLAALFVYARATSARDRLGHYALWSLAVLLLFIQVGNYIGPPPPGVTAIAAVGMAQWLFVIWGGWIERHRSTEIRRA